MGSSSVDFSLGLKPSYVPRTISNLFKDISKIDNLSARLLILNDHLQKHQEELSRIELLRHHLPQCMLLLMDAIEALKKEVMNVKNGMMSESNEKDPVEFLSTKRRNCDILQRDSFEKFGGEEKNACSLPTFYQSCKLNHGDKKQKTTPNNTSPEQVQPQNTKVEGFHKGSVLFIENNIVSCHPLVKYGNLFSTLTSKDCSVSPNSSSVSAARQPGSLRIDSQAMNFQPKGNRRTWTSELHEKFLEALKYLGGPEVASPKRIRDVMKVDGLTNDQVKSHLQKYRISLKRAAAIIRKL